MRDGGSSTSADGGSEKVDGGEGGNGEGIGSRTGARDKGNSREGGRRARAVKGLGTAAGAVPTERQSVPRTVVMPAILAELRDNIMFTPVTRCWLHSSFCSARNAE